MISHRRLFHERFIALWAALHTDVLAGAAAVGDCVRELHSVIRTQGIPCCLEWNDGNHFTDPDRRTAKDFAWLLKNAAGR